MLWYEVTSVPYFSWSFVSWDSYPSPGLNPHEVMSILWQKWCSPQLHGASEDNVSTGFIENLPTRDTPVSMPEFCPRPIKMNTVDGDASHRGLPQWLFRRTEVIVHHVGGCLSLIYFANSGLLLRGWEGGFVWCLLAWCGLEQTWVIEVASVVSLAPKEQCALRSGIY